MRSSRFLAITAATTVSALQTQCPNSANACFSLGLSNDATTTGSGDIFIQIACDASKYSWISLAQGSSMDGANYFVVYTSSDGKNVTLSTRQSAGGHSMPTHNSSVPAQLMEGSGVVDGVLVANIKCTNCASWSGGSMDLTAYPTQWIWGQLAGSALNTDDASAQIPVHSDYGSFSFDDKAKNSDNNNPFALPTPPSSNCSSSTSMSPSVTTTMTMTVTSTTTSTMDTSSPSPTDSPSSRRVRRDELQTAEQMVRKAMGLSPERALPSQVSCNNRSTNATTTVVTAKTTATISPNDPMQAAYLAGGLTKQQQRNMILSAHAVFACFTFVIFLPLGGIAIRTIQTKLCPTLKLHIGLQIAAYISYIIATGVGIWLALHGAPGAINKTHPVLGLLIFTLLPVQAIAGYMHHLAFVAKGTRSIASHVHLWMGRLIISFGLLNGILGFQMAGNASSGGAGAYYFFGSVMWIAYVFCIWKGEKKRRAVKKSKPEILGLGIVNAQGNINTRAADHTAKPTHASWAVVNDGASIGMPRSPGRSSAVNFEHGVGFSMGSRDIEIGYLRGSQGSSGLSPRLPRKSFASSVRNIGEITEQEVIHHDEDEQPVSPVDFTRHSTTHNSRRPGPGWI